MAHILVPIYFGDQLVALEIRHHGADASLSIINMILSDEDKILIQSLYLKEYTAKRLADEFPKKLDKAWC